MASHCEVCREPLVGFSHVCPASLTAEISVLKLEQHGRYATDIAAKAIVDAAELETRLVAAEAKAARILDAYHASYRHGSDSDPKRCPGCHAAALEDA